jgi:hypothetical protein
LNGVVVEVEDVVPWPRMVVEVVVDDVAGTVGVVGGLVIVVDGLIVVTVVVVPVFPWRLVVDVVDDGHGSCPVWSWVDGWPRHTEVEVVDDVEVEVVVVSLQPGGAQYGRSWQPSQQWPL